jgi:exopolyphosphatase / guanosine-5'-triphosphate,3'-diphosphate pyrophosphatase
MFRSMGFVEAVGSSGTITSIDGMLRAGSPGYAGITRAGIKALRELMIERGHTDKLDLPGLSPERRGVIAGGIAILHAAFKAFAIEPAMRASKSALREGLLLELVGGLGQEEVRERTISRLRDRYACDAEQGRRVEETALLLAQQLASQWQLGGRELRMLRWASLLHELGQALSFGGYHRHGAYIIGNSDLPGFSEQGQAYLAALVSAHRRRFDLAKLTQLRQIDGERAVRVAALLRSAVLVNRSREAAPKLEIHVIDNRVELVFPSGFLDTHPLTRGDLEEEQAFLRDAALELSFR